MKLADLIQWCKDLGLNPEPTKNKVLPDGTRTKVLSMADCEKAIREYYLEERKRKGTYDKSIEFMLSMVSPMLALQIKHLKPEVQEAVWDDNNTDWVFEQKIDGNRQLIIWDSESQKFHFYSRNESVQDLLPIDYADKILIPNLNTEIMGRLQSFVLDCEVVPLYGDKHDDRVVAKSQLNIVSSILQYLPEESKHIQETNPLKSVVFDCLYFNGEYLFDKPLFERHKYMNQIVQLLHYAGFSNIDIVPTKPANMTKEDYYFSIIDSGGEGIVAKNINDTYDTQGKRDGRWVKIKRTAQLTLSRMGFGDSIDAFLTGFTYGTPGTKNEGKIGALIFSVYLTDENNDYLVDENNEPIIHNIAQISGFSDSLRDILTWYDDDGNIMINPRFFGAVAEINGQDISSQDMKLMHAVFLKWRPDRTAESCKIKESILRSMIM